jgi:hypothetical protein
VADAPPPIRTAGEAVVEIATAGSFATAAFLSPGGILLTNNHVLGVDVCPTQGCYAQIWRRHQRGVAPADPETIFVVPLAVDVGLDMTVVQAYEGGPSGPPVGSPSYLTIASRDPASLRGLHVNVVGHPEGHLKKWTEGEVSDSDGAWIYFSAYALPGNSGSPVLDDEGHLVGLLHRGPTTQDLISNDGIDEYSIGTASSALIPAMRAPLPAEMWSLQASTTDDDIVKHDHLYLNARQARATVNGSPRFVLDALGAACDTALARQDYTSPDDLSSGMAPCYDAELWIECRADIQTDFAVCPEDRTAWQARFQAVYDRWRAFNGTLDLDSLTFAQAALASSFSDGLQAGTQRLQQRLAQANAPLDLNIAAYLAAFQVDSYMGTPLLDYVRGYAGVPGYTLAATAVAAGALWLNRWMQLGTTDEQSILNALLGDPRVPVGAKLYVEDLLYKAKALN